MPTPKKRPYRSARRASGALQTRTRIVAAAKHLFWRRGIDATTIAEIAARARVAEATVYATLQSKTGILRELMRAAIFGPRFQDAIRMLDGKVDPVELIALTAHVARAIYEGESAELKLLMQSSAFSPELRALQQEFEGVRMEMQRERIALLARAGRLHGSLDEASARQLLWMYTSRDVYRMLVHESGWTPERYQEWLSATLIQALTERAA